MEDPGRAHYARAMQFYHRYHADWVTDDLNSAIEAGQLAIQSTPLGHVDMAARCSDLATMFSERYQEKEIPEDITEAIKLASDAVAAAPPGYSYRPAFLNNLGLYFGMRYDQLEELDDLNQAIANTNLAIALASTRIRTNLTIGTVSPHILSEDRPSPGMIRADRMLSDQLSWANV